jgi:hypothetical protein
VKHLPHILLGGTRQGVPLQSDEFDEATGAGFAAPRVSGDHVAARRRRRLALRSQRFQEVLAAIEILIAWTKAERKNFQQRVLGIEPVGQAGNDTMPQEAIR